MTGFDKLKLQTDLLEKIKSPELNTLAHKFFWECSDLGDFLWKAPKFIEAERAIEEEKQAIYFPFNGDPEHDAQMQHLKNLRYQLENRKLNLVFPKQIAAGNLFVSLATYEFYCLQLAFLVEAKCTLKLKDVRGNGIGRIHKYLKKAGIEVEGALFHAQTRAAMLVRNCLFHANGILSLSRDHEKLIQLIKGREFDWMEAGEHRARKVSADDLVLIRNGEFGKELVISAEYPHTALGFVRGHFVDLCVRADK